MKQNTFFSLICYFSREQRGELEREFFFCFFFHHQGRRSHWVIHLCEVVWPLFGDCFFPLESLPSSPFPSSASLFPLVRGSFLLPPCLTILWFFLFLVEYDMLMLVFFFFPCMWMVLFVMEELLPHWVLWCLWCYFDVFWCLREVLNVFVLYVIWERKMAMYLYLGCFRDRV